VRARFGSYRFRRRVAWGAAVAAVGVAIAAAFAVGNTGRKFDAPLSNERAWVYHAPKAHKLSARERDALLQTAAEFVRTAVARRDLDRAWELTGPDLRGGQSRREFMTGDNAVVPFPVRGIKAWSVAYSYEDDVAFDLALVARPGEDVVGKTFTIELRRDAARGWLVTSWVPKGLTDAGQSISKATAPEAPPPRAPLSSTWLLLPLGLLGLIVVTPIALALRVVLQTRRAERRYARELGGYSSSSSPS